MRRCCLLLVCLLLLTGCGRADTQDVSSFAPAEAVSYTHLTLPTTSRV